MPSSPVVRTAEAVDLGDLALIRGGTIMTPSPDEPFEVEGVLNPGSAVGRDGLLRLYPRLVGRGNRSRIGRAVIEITRGLPSGVHREGVALEPALSWEHGVHHGGLEDPRITWIETLGRHVMTYIAFGPLGPKPALAVSDDGFQWQRLGPLQFEYEPAWEADFNLYPNKDLVFFPEPVADPAGRRSYALLHRPMWDFSFSNPDESAPLPRGIDDARPGIWISYVDADAAEADVRALTRPRGHRPVAQPRFEWEHLKIGAGPSPIRTADGWLVIHHGVSGRMVGGAFQLQHHVRYSAGAMLLDLDDPGTVLARSERPLLEPESESERDGAVSNVVFPTAAARIDGAWFVFYGMADSRIGVARLSGRLVE